MKFAVLVFVLGVAMAHAGEIADQFPKHPKEHVSQWREDADGSANHGIKQIGVEYTACLGTCPVFTLIVNSDATFRYSGDGFVKRRGKWHGTVAPEQLAILLRYVSKMGFFDLYDEYSSNDSDLPGAYLMVVTRTRKKIIYNYGGIGPAKLDAFEYMIDGLMDEAKWKRD